MSAPAVGVLTLELHLTESRSLKDKRHYVKGLKDRLRSKFNVSVAEVDDQEVWTRTTIAIAVVSPSQSYARELLEKAEADAAAFLGRFLVSATVDWME